MVLFKHPLRRPYLYTLCAMVLFVLFAFLTTSWQDLYTGLWEIIKSRSLLTTDYIELAGIGPAFLNAALTGSASIMLMYFSRAKANGALLMGIWLVIGFSFFGKNIFNIWPIILGVWLYSRYQKEPFLNYSLTALLATTVTPLVSEFAFMGNFPPAVELLLGICMGVAAGFIIPIIAAATAKVHGGYDLYNVGFASGILCVFIMAFCSSGGLEIERPFLWSEGDNFILAFFLYVLMLGWVLLGLVGKKRKENLKNCKQILQHSGRLVSDYFLLYDDAVYINMGVLGILGITVTLVLGAPLNGGTIAGIITMMAFGCFGKHLRNCLPIMVGAALAANWNHLPVTSPGNILGILFGTGLAPIAGQFGVIWGVVAGFLHVIVVGHVGQLTGGLNLYNNGFAAGFVALVLVPIILAFRRREKTDET